MGVIVASGVTISTAANTRSADQVTGTYQFLPSDGTITIYGRGSAVGMKCQLFANGQALANDLDIAFFGATGGLSMNDHELASFDVPAGARLEFFLRNTTGGALTTDYLVAFDPD